MELISEICKCINTYDIILNKSLKNLSCSETPAALIKMACD